MVVPQPGLAGSTESAPSSGAGLTITDATTVLDPLSRIVTATPTSVSDATGFGASTTLFAAIVCAIGRTAELLEKAWYGGVPPEMVSVAGTPEKTVSDDGSTVSGGMIVGGTYGLFGAPLPPPQALRANIAARAKRPPRGRSHAVIDRFAVMSGILMIMS
jgi:hypothetical protein